MAGDLAARLTRVMNVLESINRATSRSRLTGGEGVPTSLQEAVLHTAALLEARKPVQKQSPEEFEAGRAARAKARQAKNERRAGEQRDKRDVDAVRARLTAPPAEPEAEKKALRGAAAEEKFKSLRKGKGEHQVAQAAPIAGKPERAERTFRTLINDRPEQKIEPQRAVGRRQNMPQPRGEFPAQHQAAQEKKSADLDWHQKERDRRGLGRGERGDRDYVPAALKAKASKLARMKLAHPAHRDRDHDDAKGYDKKEHPQWKGHHVGADGKPVHSSGKKANKKFANATTFKDSDTDALLHTDKSRDGARADADASEFAFHGDLKKDPRQKWYRVSKEGGYASAMASLGKAYHKDPKMRAKVVQKVKEVGFVDSKGHQIDVKPTGALHNERGVCVRDNRGVLGRAGKELQRRDPSEWSRICKGPHGSSGTPTRNEYERGFDPRHDDISKIRKLHKAAESGKAETPTKNIAAHAAARPQRRQDVHDMAQHIGRAASRTKWRLRNG